MRKLLTRLAIGALIVNVMIMVGSATSGMVDVNNNTPIFLFSNFKHVQIGT